MPLPNGDMSNADDGTRADLHLRSQISDLEFQITDLRSQIADPVVKSEI